MVNFIIFLISLTLIIILLFLKRKELNSPVPVFWSKLFFIADLKLLKVYLKIRHFWNHINFRNCKLIFLWLTNFIKKMILNIKRHFDHKQSHFFVKKGDDWPKNKGAVSFFLKDVSAYKKSLREKKSV